MTFRKSELIIIVSLAVALLVANVKLVLQNRRLAALAEARLRALEPPIGAVVPPLHGFDIHSKELTLGYGNE